MDTEHSSVDNSPQCQIIKHLAAIPPDVCASVLARALVVKAIHLCDLPRLMVPSDECDAIRVANLVCEEEQEGLYAVEPSIDKVTYKTYTYREKGEK